MSEEFKTLRDFENECDKYFTKKYHPNLVNPADLRREAIKWVKAWEELDEEIGLDNSYRLFLLFFNIKESELKQKLSEGEVSHDN